MSVRWTLADMPSQAEKRFFITGANSGIGYAAALELARRGAVVVLACRDRARGEAALTRLRTQAAGPGSAADQAELVVLDLASLESVRRVATEEVARHQPLHGLINNAGIFAPSRRQETKDGFELQFGTNVLGPFALTCGLMQAFEMTRGTNLADAPRVVTVSSIAHKQGHLDFDDLQSKQKYRPRDAYAQSKLADLMFAFELERRSRAQNLGTVSIAVHPGVARSNLFKVGSGQGVARIAEHAIASVVGLTLNSEEDGALPTLFASTAASAQGGAYYGPQGLLEMRGGDVGPAQVAKQALDVDAQRRLWETCEAATGCGL